MTTDVEIVAGSHKELAQQGAEYMAFLVNTFNRYKPDSELSLLHSKKETWTPVSEELFHLLKLSEQMSADSDGVFRLDYEGLSNHPEGTHGFELDKQNRSVYLHADTQLNPGGIGKGYIVDQVAEFLSKQGGTDIMVNAGGDLRVIGDYSWKIGLFNPLDTSIAFGHVKLKKGAVVTSGTYARQHSEAGKTATHFFDTKNKKYIEKPPYASVTVIGERASISEVQAKLLLMGNKKKIAKKIRAIGVTYPDYKVVSL